MKSTFRWCMLALVAIATMTSCSSVEPNYEGVLMNNYGRNGKSDFKSVQGRQTTIWAGTKLYQVPMFEQKADPTQVVVTSKDGGAFTVDPTYNYAPIRGKGVDIIFNYKHVGVDEPSAMMDNIEANVLNVLVTNAYREEARNFTTDSLLTNVAIYETAVENRLKDEFEKKFFSMTPGSLTSGLKPPGSMIDAINKRNNVKIEAETAKAGLETSRQLLEKAKIDAETNRVRSEGLTAKNLQEQWIEAIRNTQNKVIITDGKTPVIFTNQ